MGLDGALRPDPRLRRGDQADRLVPPPARSWPGRPGIASRRAFEVLLVGMAIAAVVLFAPDAALVERPDRRGRADSSSRTSAAAQTHPHQGPVPRHRSTTRPKQSLPWYNTIVWTVLVTPVGFLVMGVLGLGRGGGPTARASRSGC